MPTPEQPVAPNSQEYFLNSQEKFDKKNGFLSSVKSFWRGFQYYARQVWPYVNRLITFLVYEVVTVTKGIVKIALSQVGMFKN